MDVPGPMTAFHLRGPTRQKLTLVPKGEGDLLRRAGCLGNENHARGNQKHTEDFAPKKDGGDASTVSQKKRKHCH